MKCGYCKDEGIIPMLAIEWYPENGRIK